MPEHSTNRVRRVTPFKQIDVTRFARGVVAAGLTPATLEIDRYSGNLIARIGSDEASTKQNDWD